MIRLAGSLISDLHRLPVLANGHASRSLLRCDRKLLILKLGETNVSSSEMTGFHKSVEFVEYAGEHLLIHIRRQILEDERLVRPHVLVRYDCIGALLCRCGRSSLLPGGLFCQFTLCIAISIC